VSDSQEFIELRRAFKLALGYEQCREESGSGNETPGILLKKRTGQDRSRSRQELDVELALRLSPVEARRGLETVVRYRRLKPCPHCRARCPTCRGLVWLMVQEARGLVRRACPTCRAVWSKTCPACAGQGRLEEESEAHVLIPANVQHHQLLILPGRGHRSESEAGHLILRIEITSG
ncbi:MAG: hypothetical protein JRJ59_03225, partial [Deltaproteobacteria bacterium]|nr:hypothetical protein [Deltaproteobacteria bacterium]